MNYSTSPMVDGPSSASPDATDFALDDWSTSAPEDALPEFHMAESSDITSPGSEFSSQSTDGPFAQVEIDIELQSGIMDDYEWVGLSPTSCQANIGDVTDGMCLSPQLLSRTQSIMVARLPVLQSSNEAPNSLQSGQNSRNAIVTTSTNLFPPTRTAPDQPRRGRGRTKLPVELLKSV